MAAKPPRAGSLIVTVFGDSISQHGNIIWLGSLISSLAPFGLNARQIRTAIYRLVQDNWLTNDKVGRRSYYSFTDFGHRQYEKSAQRIYRSTPPPWNGQWTLILLGLVDSALREKLKRELHWQGFGALTHGVLAHPAADHQALAETLGEFGVQENVVCLRATAEQIQSRTALAKLVRHSWNLDDLAQRYRDFVSDFEPALQAREEFRISAPAQMFELQTLLIHNYRRIVLQTTDIPEDLLPTHWPGRAAMKLVAELYDVIRGRSALHLETFSGLKGSLPPAHANYYQRYTPGITIPSD